MTSVHYNQKDNRSYLTTTLCNNQFTCSPQARLILSMMIQKHPDSLKRNENGSIRSFIVEHSKNTGHSTKSNSAFEIIYEVSINFLKTPEFFLHSIADIFNTNPKAYRYKYKRNLLSHFISCDPNL
ncbi:uncharacterized protein Smp_203820 [Schistosoma mansoni]|uniref:uncharacterized protein n=1 Tax=Schistosoma mansoni TaxID=6183 RepID=UPI00022DCC8C|nr:uncharacterized protein Smp_203820 [Schistosoma mansoni]|eukprot:XP_018655196.1 uncharacterized protein Smp_203820 [Schistosoma mansoni]